MAVYLVTRSGSSSGAPAGKAVYRADAADALGWLRDVWRPGWNWAAAEALASTLLGSAAFPADRLFRALTAFRTRPPGSLRRVAGAVRGEGSGFMEASLFTPEHHPQ